MLDSTSYRLIQSGSLRDGTRAVRAAFRLVADGTAAAGNGRRSPLLFGARLRTAATARGVVPCGHAEHVQHWARLRWNGGARIVQSAPTQRPQACARAFGLHSGLISEEISAAFV